MATNSANQGNIVVNIRDVVSRRPARVNKNLISIYSGSGANTHAMPGKSPVSENRRTYVRNNYGAKDFIIYLLRGKNIGVLVVSVSIIALLVLCSFALNAGSEKNPPSEAAPDNYTYYFAGGPVTDNAFTVCNPAFAAISENVYFTITDGMSDSVRVSLPPMKTGEALAGLGITLSPDDVINCGMDDIVTDGVHIVILRADSRIRQVSEDVPFEIQVIEVDTVKKGTTQIAKKGIPGTKVQYYEQEYSDGDPVGEVLVGEKVIQEPVTQIVYKGVGGSFTAPNGEMYNYSYVISVQATAYGDVSEGKNPKWRGITYTGTSCRPGVIAVDPNLISLHSRVYVTGEYGDYGICAAEDIGTSIKGAIIDIYMESKEEMVKFGRRAMKAYVLE